MISRFVVEVPGSTPRKLRTYKNQQPVKNIAAVSCSPMTLGSAGPGFGFWLTGKLGRAWHRCMGGAWHFGLPLFSSEEIF